MQLKREMPLRFLWKLVRFLILTGISFVLLYPIMYMVSVGFRPSGDLFDPTVIWLPNSLTFENLAESFKAMEYPVVLFNSVKISLVTSIIQVIACSIFGYSFARLKFKGHNFLFGILILTIIVPPQMVTIPSFLQFRFFDFFGIGSLIGVITGKPLQINLVDTLFVFYLPALFGLGIRSGLFIFIFRQFFRNMPKELEDSAYVDGCSILSTYFRIIIPNAGTVFLTAFLFTIIWYWNDYFYAGLFLNKMRTVSTSLYNITSELTNYVSAKSKGTSFTYDPYVFITRIQAACILVITPVLLMYVFLQKYFTESIERTGIVG